MERNIQARINGVLRDKIDNFIKENELTIVEFISKSAEMFMTLKNFEKKGYKLIVKKEDEEKEKEIIFI